MLLDPASHCRKRKPGDIRPAHEVRVSVHVPYRLPPVWVIVGTQLQPLGEIADRHVREVGTEHGHRLDQGDTVGHEVQQVAATEPAFLAQPLGVFEHELGEVFADGRSGTPCHDALVVPASS